MERVAPVGCCGLRQASGPLSTKDERAAGAVAEGEEQTGGVLSHRISDRVSIAGRRHRNDNPATRQKSYVYSQGASHLSGCLARAQEVVEYSCRTPTLKVQQHPHITHPFSHKAADLDEPANSTPPVPIAPPQMPPKVNVESLLIPMPSGLAFRSVYSKQHLGIAAMHYPRYVCRTFVVCWKGGYF